MQYRSCVNKESTTRFPKPEPRFALFLSFLSIPLLFLPKVNILSIRGQTAGLRIDDFILLLLFPLFLLIRFSVTKKITRFEQIFLGIVTIYFLSFTMNRFSDSMGWRIPNQANLLYCFRFIEYFSFFYIGYFYYRIVSLHRVIKILFLWCALLLTFQKLNLIGAVGSAGEMVQSVSRTQGISTFPAEMGLILNMMYCFFLYEKKSTLFSFQLNAPLLKRTVDSLAPYFLFSIFFLLILFTGARIALLSVILTFGCYQWGKLKRGISTLFWQLTLFVILIIIGLVLIEMTKSISQRTALFSWENFSLIADVWNSVDFETTRAFDRVVKLEDYSVDISWWMRVQNWIYFLKHLVYSPIFWLFGFGPGSAGYALDGSLLRIVIEGGIIGTFFYFLFFRTIMRVNKTLKWIVINYTITMVFIDAHIAYKSMALLLLMTGYFIAEKSDWKRGKKLDQCPSPSNYPRNFQLDSKTPD